MRGLPDPCRLGGLVFGGVRLCSFLTHLDTWLNGVHPEGILRMAALINSSLHKPGFCIRLRLLLAVALLINAYAM